MILNVTRSFAAVVSKLVPLIVTEFPTTPIDGENDVMVGACDPVVTVNVALLVADPPGAVTWMVPVVAPLGTVATSFVVVAVEIVALVPLKATVSLLTVAEKPVPKMVTVVPTGPLVGVNVMMDTVDVACRPIARMLPTAS